jgi:acetyl-CoA acetyltransferase
LVTAILVSKSNDYRGAVLLAPVSFGYRRYSERSAVWFIGNTFKRILAAAGIDKARVDGLAVSSFSLGPDTPASLAEYFGVTLRWLEHLPFGGACGVIAARRAVRAIQAGDASIVACIAGDTLQETSFGDMIANFSGATMDASMPYGAGGANTAFGLMTAAYMEKYATTREDFGRICVAQRYNANHCAHALFRDKPLTITDYLAARPVVAPLHLYDCVMPCAGADGFLVVEESIARDSKLPGVRIAAAFESFNTYPQDPIQLRSGWSCYGRSLYAQAGIEPGDVDILQTYDDYPVVVMLQLEGLEFCRPGMAGEFVREHPLTFDGGGLAHNTSGGQLSVGQAGAAGGFLGIVEAMRQLCGQAGANQVADCETALVSGFGMVNYDRGLCSAATILTAHE